MKKRVITFAFLSLFATSSVHAYETRNVKNVDEASQSIVRADRVCGLKPETVQKHSKAVAYVYGSSVPHDAPEGLANAWYTIAGPPPSDADYEQKKEFTFYDPNEKSIAMVWAENNNKYSPNKNREIVYSNVLDLSYRADFTVRGDGDCVQRFVWLLDYNQVDSWSEAQSVEDFKQRVRKRCDQLNVADKGTSKFDIIVLKGSGLFYHNSQIMARCLISD
ncbi:hypothetical protein B9G69_013020 [Bdellovibrio sp. SKB1291214]|uniref:hypothetical protein n=1 Tax=Bdellovibrio sp. SKB1291214 TaxID=1732569 RepID=UPI000B51E2B2|nr:hypothetical protein [Bdellovibrio sp. SKB1291214]UYL07967.1 hypothetical protein B9G69_013020 [Bdellovibrio sp. SKB1291214]